MPATIKRKPRPSPPAPALDADSHVLVRMYNVGFGDCFLVEIPEPGRAVRRMLIDCGSIAKASLTMDDIVERILDDVRDDDGVARIDVIVCTHRHRDHVSGFADARWKDVLVGEVWFPWTEDPDDAQAMQIRQTQSRLAAALDSHWKAQLAATPRDERMLAYQEMALNALSNDRAMTLLHDGFRSNPTRRFLANDAAVTRLTTEALPGVTVHVMGPSRDRDVIRDMEPPAGTTYLRQLAATDRSVRNFDPFGAEWTLLPDQYEQLWPALAVAIEDQNTMQRAAGEWDPALTVALEKAVNGTSLVFALEVEDLVLLFPADAQWSTWNAMLRNEESRALLERASFWKVGHHGSHNATPVEFVEHAFRSGCCTMLSTRSGKWESIPRTPLLDAIRQKTDAFARSDEPDGAPAQPFMTRSKSFIEAQLPLRAA